MNTPMRYQKTSAKRDAKREALGGQKKQKQKTMETQIVAEIKNSPAGLRHPIQRLFIKLTKKARRNYAKCGSQYQRAEVVTTKETRKEKTNPSIQYFFFLLELKAILLPKLNFLL